MRDIYLNIIKSSLLKYIFGLPYFSGNENFSYNKLPFFFINQQTLSAKRFASALSTDKEVLKDCLNSIIVKQLHCYNTFCLPV